jgi:hypothetical protein
MDKISANDYQYFHEFDNLADNSLQELIEKDASA